MTTSTSLRFALLITAACGFLDSYTYLSRGGVFANAQTGNVILLALNLSERQWHQASGHLWPILAFLVGVVLAVHVKAGRPRTAWVPAGFLAVTLLLFVIDERTDPSPTVG